MVHVLKKVEKFYILLLTLEAKQQKDTFRHTTCQKALLKKTFLVYPLTLGPLVLSWTFDNRTETSLCFSGKDIFLQSSEDHWRSTSICVNALWVHDNVGNHFRNMELRRLWRGKGSIWREVMLWRWRAIGSEIRGKSKADKFQSIHKWLGRLRN